MKKITVMALALTLCLGAAAQAATVTFKLYLGDFAQGPGTFKLTAADTTGDNFGIASYGIELVDSPSVAGGILTVNHSSLRAASLENANGEGPAGFTLLRSADLLAAGADQDVHNIGGSQDTVVPTPHLIRGFGQAPNSVMNALAQPVTGTVSEGDNWGNAGTANVVSPPTPGEFEIARGTFTPAVGGGLRFLQQATAATFANVFTAADGIGTMEATVVRVTIPEPATLALAGMSLIGMFTASRRRKV